MSHQHVFEQLLEECVADARIALNFQGKIRSFGAKGIPADKYDVVVHVRDPRFFTRVLALRNLGLGEAYIDGDFEIEQGTLEDLLCILIRSQMADKARKNLRLGLKVAWIEWSNKLRAKHQNVQRHYDVGDDLFEAMLDPSMAYSCGYKLSPNDTLPDLQRNKFDRICQKLKLQKGDQLLDIGCGFGGLLIHAATKYGVSGLGITNSQAHAAKANRRVDQAGLSGRLRIEYGDYHKVKGEFTKVVSVGMMEHVPRSEYGRYVGTINNVMHKGGLGLIHCIGCNNVRNYHDPFIQKYIFPGSGQPKLSEMARQLEQHRLPILDAENIGRHYEPTVRAWLHNFRAAENKLCNNGYDNRFLRAFEYYLCSGVAQAGHSNTAALYHVLFTKGLSSLPWYRV
ncbi:MAG TPA: class I SAM-dependent methyltransferase [Gemmataceae bacterium]|nr:class I SAM-dependent methyltransferase [Gemmataceae bacterium]